MSGQQPKAPLLGRDEELSVILSALAAAEAGEGSLVLLGGEPGIGKSRLADEISTHARQRGFASLWGRGWEDAGAPAYWPWVQVIRAYLRQTDPSVAHDRLAPVAADLVQVLPEVADLVPDLVVAPKPDPDAARFQLFDSTATFLGTAAEDRPLLVVLDDLQAADPSSLALLRFLAAQIGEMRVLVLGTYRDVDLAPGVPLATTIAGLAREPTTKTIALRGLGRDALRTLIGTTAGVAVADPLVAAVARGTKGNPLYATEAVRLLAAEGRLDDLGRTAPTHLAVPPGVRVVIGRRLARLAPETVAALAVGAVVGPEFDADLLGHIGESGGASAAIEEAVREGLLVEVTGAPDRYRFSHDLVRETLYDELPPPRRRSIHRTVAEYLEARHGAAPEQHLAELAHHFHEGERDASTDRRTVDYASRAGARALHSQAFEEAARLYRIALAALERSDGHDPRTRLEILLALGDATSRGGEVAAARSTLLEAAEIAIAIGAPRELALAAIELGGRFPWARPGRETRLVPLLQDALVHLGGADDALRVRLLSRLACALRSTPGQRTHSDALSRQAVELARTLDDPATLSYALSGRFWAIWWPDNPEARLSLAEEIDQVASGLGDGERRIDAQLMLWLSHTELADMVTARRESAEMARLVAELRQPGHLWLGIAPRVLMALMEGDFAGADALTAAEAESDAVMTLARDDVSCARFHRFLLRREQGRVGEVEADVRASVDEFPWYPLHRSALASLLLELGRTGEAQAVLDELARDEFQALYPDNEWLLGASLAAEAAARLGDRDAAGVLLTQLEPMAGRHAIGHPEGSIGAVDRYLGLLAAALGRLDDAAGHLEDAVHINERMGARPWTAHSRHDLAVVLRARNAPGDQVRAAELDAMAEATAKELGMVMLQSRTVADASGAGRGVPGAAAVTAGTFRREGEYWTIALDGEAVRMRHSKGLGYLARLLERPGTELHALDLAGSGPGSDGRHRSLVPSDDLRLETDDGAGPALDAAAKAAYRARIEELRAEMGQAEEWNDPERAARARTEIEALTAQLAGALGLGARDRPTSSSSERARVSVTRAIRGALDRLAAESPGLARHLEVTVRTGTYCSYTPDPRVPITWER